MSRLRRLMPVFALIAAAAACGGGEERRGTGAQPAPRTDTFEQGLFDEISRFPRSEPLGPRSEKSDVVAQSFRAEGASPEQVLDYYRASLEGWDLITPPQPTGEAGTLRGKWARENWLLTISASPAPTVEGQNETAVSAYSQYSLSLAPA